MKLNGALKPHRAFPCIGSSSGAIYRHKKNNNNYNNINNNNNNNSNTKRNSNNTIGDCQKLNKTEMINNNLGRFQGNFMKVNVRNYLKMRRFQRSNFFYLIILFNLLFAICLLPNSVLCDDDSNGFFNTGFSSGLETTTPEFDYASRGSKKFGDRCESTLECGFPGSICDPKKKSCQCTENLPVTNHIDKCGKTASVNESCFFNEQCEAAHFQTECRDFRCVCRFEMSPTINKDGNMECKGKQEKREPERYVDPAMIGVLVGMALMFIIICVVLRLFSRARWRENRTIFNTPNPRLMNVSLLRDNKLLHGQERRGSRMSMRGPSRQPSMASLRPHSPNPSLGSRPGSRGSSNASATSTRSQRSNSGLATANTNNHDNLKNSTNPSHQPLIMPNITTNPAVENITVEIIEPKT